MDKCLLLSRGFTSGGCLQLPQELAHDLLLEQPLAILGTLGRVPHRIIRRQSDEPAEQQVVVKLLQQQPLRADYVERL